jgi:hypothetical protein
MRQLEQQPGGNYAISVASTVKPWIADPLWNIFPVFSVQMSTRLRIAIVRPANFRFKVKPL